MSKKTFLVQLRRKGPGMGLFSGKKGLILGVANDFSIAWAIARKLLAEGADLGFTHLPGDKMERRVRKQKIRAVERRGKYLILQLDRGVLVVHFRLDGQLVWFDSRKTSGHIDVAFEMNGGTLGFVDRRHFGRVQWAASLEQIPAIQHLGRE